MSDTPTTKKTKPKKAKAPVVVNAKEIKAWLRGIQEFAPVGWTPTTEQWEAVCEKIFALDETEGYVTESVSRSYAAEPVYYSPEPAYAPVAAYAAVQQPESSLAPAAPHQPGRLATTQSPTESGLVPVTKAGEVLEGEYKSSFS